MSEGPAARGGRRQRRNRDQASTHDEHLSRVLSLILRHRAVEFGIPIRPDGFVLVDDLFASGRLQRRARRVEAGAASSSEPAPVPENYTLDDLKAVTANNDKQRFTLLQSEEDGVIRWHIRANQGHSIPVPELELKPIDVELAASFPVVVHGTYFKAWKLIQTSPGLHRCSRMHVHLASGVPGEQHVISGMRKTAEVYIYIDMVKAIQAGVKFFVSTNGVILTPGDEHGYLSREFFSAVADSSGTPLKLDSEASSASSSSAAASSSSSS